MIYILRIQRNMKDSCLLKDHGKSVIPPYTSWVSHVMYRYAVMVVIYAYLAVHFVNLVAKLLCRRLCMGRAGWVTGQDSNCLYRWIGTSYTDSGYNRQLFVRVEWAGLDWPNTFCSKSLTFI